MDAAVCVGTENQLQEVWTIFGAEPGKIVTKQSLWAILKELDPNWTDNVAEQLFAASGACVGNSVHLRDFLAWIFDGGVAESTPKPTRRLSMVDTNPPTKVYFCRHGETDWNASHKLQGRSDIPLNDAGREQAKCIANALEVIGVAAVWSSPLQRAKDTAEAIAATVGVQVVVDDRLRERNLGVMEGKTNKELQDEMPKVWDAWQHLDELPPEAECEPEPEVIARVEAAMCALAAENQGKSVAIVSHGGVLRCLCKRTFGNASISTFKVSGDRWWTLQLDDASHLSTPGLKV